MLSHLLGLIARKEIQPLWKALYRLSIGGMGYMNTDPKRNGEYRYLTAWAKRRKRDSKRPVVFDIGANEGEFTKAILDVLGDVEIHSFEPNPLTFARLSERYRDNDRVILNEVGVGAEACELTLYDHKGAKGSEHASLLPETFTDIYPAESEETQVEITTVDQYLDEHRIEVVDFVKIDVEGFEQSVFAGMSESIRRKQVRAIQFEFNAHNVISGLSLYKIGKILAGYDVHKILPNGIEPVLGKKVPYNSRIEVFKYSNYVAVA